MQSETPKVRKSWTSSSSSSFWALDHPCLRYTSRLTWGPLVIGIYLPQRAIYRFEQLELQQLLFGIQGLFGEPFWLTECPRLVVLGSQL